MQTHRKAPAQQATQKATQRAAQLTPEHSAIDSTHRVVHVCAVAIRDRAGRVLTVRKAGTSGFMMPGGKPEPGEGPEQTARREVLEEVGIDPDPRRLHRLGLLHAPALNESGFTVSAETFEYAPTIEQLQALEAASPRAEIAELRWVDPADASAHEQQAPLNTERIFPLLARRPLPEA